MDEKKLEAIKEWKPPTSVRGIWSFTRFVNFYRNFIPDFSNIVAPLNLLTHKGEPWVWTQLQQEAFECLKHIFSSASVLRIPDVTCPFSIMTDASLLAAGAVLMQVDKNSDLHPCAYFSCAFSSAQCNYDIYDCYDQLSGQYSFPSMCTLLSLLSPRSCLVYGGPIYLHVRSPFLFSLTHS